MRSATASSNCARPRIWRSPNFSPTNCSCCWRARAADAFVGVADSVALAERRLWMEAFVDEPVLPFAGIAVVADRSVERHVAAEAAVHVDHVLLGHAQPFGDELDLIGTQVALFQRGDLALGLAQGEEQLLLVGGGALLHQRPRARD